MRGVSLGGLLAVSKRRQLSLVADFSGGGLRFGLQARGLREGFGFDARNFGLRLGRDLLGLRAGAGLDQLRLAVRSAASTRFMISWRLPGKTRSFTSARRIATP